MGDNCSVEGMGGQETAYTATMSGWAPIGNPSTKRPARGSHQLGRPGLDSNRPHEPGGATFRLSGRKQRGNGTGPRG